MRMKTLRLRVSERSSQKFKLYAVSEVTCKMLFLQRLMR